MPEQLADVLLRYTDAQPGESPFMTPIEGMAIMRLDHPKPPSHMISKPALCVVAQGAKWATFGGNRLVYRAGQVLVIGVEALSIGRVVEASPDEPCLVLAFELDLAIMRSVADKLDDPPVASGDARPGIFVTDFQGPLADCALRLARLLDTPKAVAVLRPLHHAGNLLLAAHRPARRGGRASHAGRRPVAARDRRIAQPAQPVQGAGAYRGTLGNRADERVRL